MRTRKALYTAELFVFALGFSLQLLAAQNTYIADSPMASPDSSIMVTSPTVINQSQNRFTTSMDSEDLMQSLYLTLLGFRWVWDSPTNTFNTTAAHTPFFDLANQTNAYNIQLIKHDALYHALNTYGARYMYSTNRATYVRTDGTTKDITVYSLLPFYLDNMFAPYGIYNTLSAYTNVATRYYQENTYNFDYPVPYIDPLTGYLLYENEFMQPFQSPEEKSAYLEGLAWSRVFTPESRIASILQNLFDTGQTDSMNIPTGGFEKSKFAGMITNAVARPLDENQKKWEQQMDLHMAALQTNRIASTSLITNQVKQIDNKLNALNQAIGSPQDLGNNDTMLGRVVHIDEDLHDLKTTLEGIAANITNANINAGGSGGTSGDPSDGSFTHQGICYFGVSWSNWCQNTSLKVPLGTGEIENYLDNWQELFPTLTEGDERLQQLFGLWYTQTLLLANQRHIYGANYRSVRQLAASATNLIDGIQYEFENDISRTNLFAGIYSITNSLDEWDKINQLRSKISPRLEERIEFFNLNMGELNFSFHADTSGEEVKELTQTIRGFVTLLYGTICVVILYYNIKKVYLTVTGKLEEAENK